MQDEQGFAWEDRYLLGFNPMDNTHREFVELVDRLLTVDDSQLEKTLADFAAHAIAHFEQENAWMETDGFPARDCHVDEHNKVLESVRDVQKLLAEGDTAIVRDLAQALKTWFPEHADYMDSALATWMVKRTHGGRPFVFRRQSGAGQDE